MARRWRLNTRNVVVYTAADGIVVLSHGERWRACLVETTTTGIVYSLGMYRLNQHSDEMERDELFNAPTLTIGRIKQQ